MARSGRIDRTWDSDDTRFWRPAALDDLYYYLLTAYWPVLLLMIAGLFVAANLIFALAYFLDGGLEGGRPGSFADAFFFSVQTMATIGYGKVSPASTFANLMVAAEAVTGLVGLAMVTGLVFAKFSRPTARVRFSSVAVIAPRDGVPCLMFRMANLRGDRIVEASIHVALGRYDTTAEGDTMYRIHDLKLLRHQNPIFSLSWTAIHPIIEDSPLIGETRESLAALKAQIVVSLTGLDETFNQTIHARHQYNIDDIVWNARFADVFNRLPNGEVKIALDRFDDVVPIIARRES
jgi:inward rectifier potassium channel